MLSRTHSHFHQDNNTIAILSLHWRRAFCTRVSQRFIHIVVPAVPATFEPLYVTAVTVQRISLNFAQLLNNALCQKVLQFLKIDNEKGFLTKILNTWSSEFWPASSKQGAVLDVCVSVSDWDVFLLQELYFLFLCMLWTCKSKEREANKDSPHVHEHTFSVIFKVREGILNRHYCTRIAQFVQHTRVTYWAQCPRGPGCCCGVRSRWRLFLNQLLTWVSVRPVFFAKFRFSSGVGYLRKKQY